jgi:hypothetical protein
MSKFAVTVFCSSSREIDQIYFDVAQALGAAIGCEGWSLVYGGNRIGLMGTLADAVRAARGRVIGVTPQIFIDQKVNDPLVDELIISQGMRDRKEIMAQRGDAFVALPGGLGTFEEIFDIIVNRQLGYHNKPIVLLNAADYYDTLIKLIEQGIEARFIKPAARELFRVTDTVAETIQYLQAQHVGPGGGAAICVPASTVPTSPASD